MKTNWDFNTISSPGCFITRGKINCSTVIYKDKKTWRMSRHKIEDEIHTLKQKLETLKEIRRHLKNTRPIDTLNGTELNEFNELYVHHISATPSIDHILRPMSTDSKFKKKKKRPSSKLPIPTSETFNFNMTDIDNVTNSSPDFTTDPTLDHTNPHRHGHHRLHIMTTTRNSQISTTAQTPERRIISTRKVSITISSKINNVI